MERKFKEFNIKLTVKTPIHIGSGLQYLPIDYVININNDSLSIIDQEQLIEAVNADERVYQKFISQCENFHPNNTGLVRFIRDLGKGKYRYSVKVSNDALEYINANQNALHRAPIDKFIRNPLDDTPYIPGSSVKGTIRTAILEVFFRKLKSQESNSEDKCLDDEFRDNILKEKLNNKYNNAFKDSDDNDIAKYIYVSDFYPADTVSMEIYKPKNKKGNREIQDRGIPVFLECAKPKYSSFKGTVRIEERFFEAFNDTLEKFGASKEKLVDINNFDKSMFASWIRVHYFDKVYDCERKTWGYTLDGINRKTLQDNSSFIVKLGKHGGALSKTIAGIRKIKVRISRNQSEDKPSQTTLWFVDNKPMGWLVGEFV